MPGKLKNGKCLYKNVAIGFFKYHEITIIKTIPSNNTTSLINPLLRPDIILTLIAVWMALLSSLNFLPP